MQKKVLIFDFDGVIADTLDMGFSINREMVPDLTYDEWTSWFEGNVYDNLRKECSSQACQDEFHSIYGERIISAAPFWGVKTALRKLSAEYRLIIVSSSSSSGINKFLKENKLNSLFEEVLGSDVHVKKTEKFRMILQTYNITPQDTLIVTDSVGDIKEGKIVGIKTIGAGWGIHDKERLSLAHPDKIISGPGEIRGAVKELLG